MAPDLAPLLLYLVLGAALAISLVTDLRSRLILDVVTLPTAAIALGVRFALVGWGGDWGLASGLVGAVIGLGVFLAPAWLGGMGMGDVKLMGAVGAALGLRLLPQALVAVALAGGLLALVVMIRAGAVGRTLRRVALLLLPAALRRRLGPAAVEEPIFLPYGVAIAAGTAATILLQGIGR